MIAFVETSFLCSAIRRDAHTAKAIAWLKKTTQPPLVSTLVLYEFRQSLRIQSFLHKQGHPAGTEQSLTIRTIGELQDDLAKGRYEITNPDWPAVHAQAETLSAKHTETTGVRFADILHVATALNIGAREFLTFDSGQRALAEVEGLTVPL